MCYFITELLPENTDPAIYDICFKSLNRKLTPIENNSVLAQVGPGYRYYCGTTGPCDCSTVLGILNENRKPAEALDSEIEKLRKKKWSERKIQAWVANKEKTNRKRAHAASQGVGSAQEWIQCFREFSKTSRAKRIGLLLHFYRGQLNEPIEIKRFVEVETEDTTPELLMKLSEDVVYWFVN